MIAAKSAVNMMLRLASAALRINARACPSVVDATVMWQFGVMARAVLSGEIAEHAAKAVRSSMKKLAISVRGMDGVMA
jgi:hypothetical protein